MNPGGGLLNKLASADDRACLLTIDISRHLFRADNLGEVQGTIDLAKVLAILVRKAFDLAGSDDQASIDSVRRLACLVRDARGAAEELERRLIRDFAPVKNGRHRVRLRNLDSSLSDVEAHIAVMGDDLYTVLGEDRELDRETSSERPAPSVRPSTLSDRLLTVTARILPAIERPEYEELFRSELFDLALSGSGRWAQLAYALRVLVRAPLLRRELRAPARERSW